MKRKMEGDEGSEEGLGRDIRRYFCEFCGICRSKKKLIAAHMLSHHQESMANKEMDDIVEEENKRMRTTCNECGESFSKPAYLKQHMQSHSLERPFACPIDGCHSSYRRRDHLNRHLLTHTGKTFECPMENCKQRFTLQANMKRHVEEMHTDETREEHKKQHICHEVGCGKTFKYASKLNKHEASHAHPEYVEVICTEPGCGKFFSNTECLKEHMESCHRFIPCEVCGLEHLKKNIKRHMQSHTPETVGETIKCTEIDCHRTFSNTSNLRQHIKAVHLGERRFPCSVNGCGKQFCYKHVRINHEKIHFRDDDDDAHDDFVEADERLLHKPRGGRRKEPVTAETLLTKRVIPDCMSSVLDDGNQYLSWLLADNGE